VEKALGTELCASDPLFGSAWLIAGARRSEGRFGLVYALRDGRGRFWRLFQAEAILSCAKEGACCVEVGRKIASSISLAAAAL